jgi:DEP domain-containing protein 5
MSVVMAKPFSVRVDDTFAEDAISLTYPENYTEGFKEGNYLELSLSESREDLILRVIGVSNKGNKWEATISKVVAEHLSLSSLSSKIFLSLINSKDIELEFAMVTIKRLFVQRGDIMRFKDSICGRMLYLGQNIASDFVQAQVQELIKAGKIIKSGIVTPKTKIVCRSRSTRIFWLVQISSEMWEFDDKGNLLFEKFLQSFVEPILGTWKEKDVSHKLSIVFFSRTFYLNGPPNAHPIMQRSTFSGSSGLGKSATDSDQDRPSCGLSYDDQFKVVIENLTQFDKQEIIRTLKEEFWNFINIAGWKVSQESPACPSPQIAVPSSATDGNVLEAINITFNVLEKHYMDRDLARTGNSLVMITAGAGFYKVDPKLAHITKQRMMDNGIGMDLVSLSTPPLHMVPLFYVLPQEPESGDFYEVPHWINLQYLPQGGTESRYQTPIILSHSSLS